MKNKRGLKIYIETDLEGASGLIYSKDGEVGAEDLPAYHQYRRFLTGDVNAAVEGALEDGAEEIIVNDSHSTRDPNILISELNPKAKLLRSTSGEWLAGLDNTVNALFFVGTHAMAGTKNGFLEHTQSSTAIHNWWINGEKVGEIGQAAAFAGHFRIPLLFVCGDLASTREAKRLIKGIETVAVKEGLQRNFAKGLSPQITRVLIKEHAKIALTKIKKIKPWLVKKPIEIKIEFNRTDYASLEFAKLNKVTSAKMLDARTVVYKISNALQMFNY